MTKLRRRHEGPAPSREFLKSLEGTGGGGTFIDCTCGREHYAIDADHLVSNWDDGDFDEEKFRATLIERAKEDPDGTILHHDTDSVYYVMIDGQPVQPECPCNTLRRYEDFMWSNRGLWKKYLTLQKQRLEETLGSIGDLDNL